MMPTPFCYQTSVLKLLHNNLITRSRNLEEESPYKPEAFNPRLFRAIAHGIAHKLLFYLIIFSNPISSLQTALKFDFVF